MMSVTGLEFSQLLLRHDRALLRYIMTFIPRRDDAEEVLQRVAVSLWEKFADFDQDRDFLPWAVRFAYIEVLNFRKEQARSRLTFNQELLELLCATRRQLESELERQQGALRECLKKVDESGIALLKRRYCDSETIRDLAREQGESAKALYRRLDRVREAVAHCVRKRLQADIA